jgi:hypothetical protein
VHNNWQRRVEQAAAFKQAAASQMVTMAIMEKVSCIWVCNQPSIAKWQQGIQAAIPAEEVS